MTISRKIKAAITGSLAAICVSAIAIAGTPAKGGTPVHESMTVDTGSAVVEDANANATYDVPDSEAIDTDEGSVETVESVVDQVDTSVPSADPKSDSRSTSRNDESSSRIKSKTEEPSEPYSSISTPVSEDPEPVEDPASDDASDVEPKTDSETPDESLDDIADTISTPEKGTPDAPTRDDIDHLIQDMNSDVLDKMFEDGAVYTPSQFVDKYIEEDPDFQSVVDSYYRN